jgi:glycosyltransferase involved in cell wall biosynthesis
MTTPRISVVMSVFDAEDTVGEAINSVLAQTFGDFEFIIVDDGSTDRSSAILRNAARGDARIRLLRQSNTGLTRALNIGLGAATGTYIARQDADDVSHPERFRRQAAYLDSRPDVTVVGGDSVDVYPDGRELRWGARDEATLRRLVFRQAPFPHSSAMIRRSTLHRVGFYDETFPTSQDLELWMRLAHLGPVAMLSEVVLRRRVGERSISSRRRWRQNYDAFRARRRHGPSGIAGAGWHTARSLLINALPVRLVFLMKQLSQ